MTDSEDLSRFSVLSLGPSEVLNEDDVSHSLNVFNSMESKQKSVHTDDTQLANAVKEVETKDSHTVGLDKPSVEKGLGKCASFPFSAVSKCVSEGIKAESTVADIKHEGCAQSANSHQRAASLPTSLKLVSALKGSREKLGSPPRNLSVKWAPDVYDPIPSSVSHVPRQKPQRYRNDKRNGKNKQKAGGKASRSKGKEKKQSRKSGGSSNKPYRLSDSENCEAWSVVTGTNALDFGVDCPDHFIDRQSSVDSSGGTHGNALDYGVNNPDPFCGHSFLKKSVTPMHFSVTEAT